MPEAFVENMERDQAEELPLLVTKENCQGGTFIVTGSNQGLGYEAAKHLVQVSAAKVILAVRSTTKGEEAKSDLEAETGVKGILEVWHLDMGSYESIKAFAVKVKGLDRLDAIIENAALALNEFSLSDGLETSLMVNVTGTMLLTALVMPKMRESAQKFGIQPHIAIIGSAVAFQAPDVLEKINGDIVDWLSEEKNGMANRYPITKLVLLYAVREYASRNTVSKTGVVVNYVNPGLCKTKLNRHVPAEVRARIDAMKDKMGRTGEMGSRTLLAAVVADETTHGTYMSECIPKEDYIPTWVTDASGQTVQKRAWDSVSAHVNKIVPGAL